MAINGKSVMSLILARGGSTGVPGKNVKPIAGKPLIAHTVDVSTQSKYIDRTIVATDSDAIAQAAIDAGGEAPFKRLDEHSQKLSRAYDAYKFFLDKLKEDEGYRPDIVVLLFSTSYTKTTEQVDECIEKLAETNCDWVFTVTETEHHPYRFFQPDGDRMRAWDPTVKSYDIWGNRQELPPCVRINGNAFVTWSDHIENYSTYNIDEVEYADSDIRFVMCDQEDSMDIDTPFDFEIAEFVLGKRMAK